LQGQYNIFAWRVKLSNRPDFFRYDNVVMPLSELQAPPPLSRLASRLPTFSPIALRLLGVVCDENVSFKEVSKLIQLDAALSGEVLRLANSGYYGRRATIRSILHAIGLLGIKRITTLVITAALWGGLPRRTSPFMMGWWRHSIASALVSEFVGGPAEAAEGAYTAAILHGLGQLAMYQYAPADYETLVAEVRANGEDLLDHERRIFGVDHAGLADWILESWQVPQSIRGAVASHHERGSALGGISKIVHSGCFAAEWAGFGACGWHTCHSMTDVAPDLQKLVESEYVREMLPQEINGIECSLL
jgi:HD-like signal output (HDOD) protein